MPHLLLGLARMAHNQRHILDLAEGRHGCVARQAKQQIRARVVLRDLPHHAPVRAVAAHQVLAVYEVCTRHRTCTGLSAKRNMLFVLLLAQAHPSHIGQCFWQPYNSAYLGPLFSMSEPGLDCLSLGIIISKVTSCCSHGHCSSAYLPAVPCRGAYSYSSPTSVIPFSSRDF